MTPMSLSGSSWLGTLLSAIAGPLVLLFLLVTPDPCIIKALTRYINVRPNVNRYPPQSQGFDLGYSSRGKYDG